jgi:hypothetical protein
MGIKIGISWSGKLRGPCPFVKVILCLTMGEQAHILLHGLQLFGRLGAFAPQSSSVMNATRQSPPLRVEDFVEAAQQVSFVCTDATGLITLFNSGAENLTRIVHTRFGRRPNRV